MRLFAHRFLPISRFSTMAQKKPTSIEAGCGLSGDGLAGVIA
ncbi:MAG: hypothetical protein ACOVSW_23840 [Candidatus Kapaibacteriota bacterium]